MRSFLLLLFSCFLLSCSNEEVPVGIMKIEMSDGKKIDLVVDSIVRFDKKGMILPKIGKVESSILGYGGKELSTNKYEKWFIVEFLYPHQELNILPNKKYYAQIRGYYQEFPFSGNYDLQPIIDKDSHMGFAPHWVLRNMYSGNFLLETTESTTKRYCYLLYLGYDEQKNKVNQYFPCHPDSLIWKFDVKPINWSK